MKLGTIGVIIGIIMFVGGASLMIGLNYYWTEKDKVENVNGNFIPFVNLSRTETEFRHNFGFLIPFFMTMGGFFIMVFSSTAFMFEEQKPCKKE